MASKNLVSYTAGVDLLTDTPCYGIVTLEEWILLGP